MLLIATPGSATANSYATVAEALALLSESLAPDLATPEFQSRLSDALIWATRLLEEQVCWYGAPVTTTQSLSWPQAGVDRVGRAFSLTTIPEFLQRATAEYALALIRDSLRRDAVATSTLTAGLAGVKAVAIDDVRITIADTLTEQVRTIEAACVMPDVVHRMVHPYGDVAGGMTVPLMRM
jgi:hypothetical protein